MESKLPKPTLSMLKKPLPLTKTVLPMDRIKPTGAAGTSIIKPLSKDLTNFPHGFRSRERAASPELVKAVAVSHLDRVKLRRSRSACDIREMRSLKRPESTLAPIPAKTARMMSTATTTNKPQQRPVISTAATKKLTTGMISRSNSTVAAASKRPKAASTSAATSTSLSTTGAGKPINKRIPPYDFKARFHDLLDKHKVLKEKYEHKCEQMDNFENLPEQLEESQNLLFTTKDQLKNCQSEKDYLQQLVSSQNSKIDMISKSLVRYQDELQELKEAHKIITEKHQKLDVEVVELRQRNTELMEQNTQLSEEVEIRKEQQFRSNLERKELHNTIMDLKGNIRVFCRVRPPLDCEMEKLLCGWSYLDEATLEIQSLDVVKNKQNAHSFNFDHVFHPACTQEDIFDMVSPMIQSALDGYNICIFAYGQTGSGKTYTMDGVADGLGVIPRTVDLLFDSVKYYRSLGWAYEIKVTFLEIYNEVLYDLLSNEPKEMEIRMAKNNKNDIYVSNITEETVETAGRLRQLMQISKSNRATAATVGNERSSRSHAVTKIELIGTHLEKNEISVGSINLVDLAGSESPKTSIRMQETKNINRSLSELTNVILALLQKQDHIPYRNSKLTHLLMPSLGGNSKTLMFINVAPFQDCYVESVKSLRFAATVNSCKLAKAKRNRYFNPNAPNTANNSTSNSFINSSSSFLDK